MKELVKEWYLKYGNLTGVREKYPFIEPVTVEEVNALVEEAVEGEIIKKEVPSYGDKLILVYGAFLANNVNCGFAINTGGPENEWLTIGDLAYSYRMSLGKDEYINEIFTQAKQLVVKVCNPSYLRLKIIVDEGLEDPYIVGKEFHVAKPMSEKDMERLVKSAFIQACDYKYSMTAGNRGKVSSAILGFMGDSGDKQFKYLAGLSKTNGVPVKDTYEALGLQYVDRLEMYDKFNVYLTLADETGTCMVKSHRLDNPVKIKDMDALFYALVSDKVEELAPSI